MWDLTSPRSSDELVHAKAQERTRALRALARLLIECEPAAAFHLGRPGRYFHVDDLNRVGLHPVFLTPQSIHLGHRVPLTPISEVITPEDDVLDLKKDMFESSRRKFGADHQVTFDALKDYAATLIEHGREAEAEPLMKEVFQTTRKKMGPDHPEFFSACCKYADNLSNLGRHAKAWPVRQFAYEGRLRTLGPLDDLTVEAMDRYADTLRKNYKQARAEPFKKQVFEFKCKQLGSKSPEALAAMSSYADTLLELGRELEAQALKKEAMDIARQDPDHLDVLEAMNGYADILYQTGNEERAEELKKEVLELAREKFEPEDPKTVWALNNYAVILRKLGRQEEALPSKKQVFELTRDRFGPEHKNTVAALNNYAVTLFELGRVSEAEPMLKKVCEVTSRNLGPDHPGTRRSLDNYMGALDSNCGLGDDDSCNTELDLSKEFRRFQPTDEGVAVIMFDFDQTLTVPHVFYTLGQYSTTAGDDSERRPSKEQLQDWTEENPAVSPAGQLERLTKEHDKYNATWAFGGKERMSALKGSLQRLHDRGIKMLVCTFGYPAAAKKLLEEADMLQYFGWDDVPSVIGQSGDTYLRYWTPYDYKANRLLDVKEDPEEILQSSKVELLDTLLEKEGSRFKTKFPLSAGVIVEDDPAAIRHAKRYSAEDSPYDRVASKGQLRYVEVVERKGLRIDAEMKELLEMAQARPNLQLA